MGPVARKTPIVAIATATGSAGVGVIRISGENLSKITEALCKKLPKPRTATLINLVNHMGQTIDSCLAIHFPAPASFTGEDVLELQCHGGAQLLELVLARCLELGRAEGLSIAQPGEFSLRAFLNGKIDLAQAEAIADLISAQSGAAVMGAARSLQGQFSQDINALVDELTQLRILVESTLDFPEEEIEFLENAHAKERLAAIQHQVKQLELSANQGRILRDGIRITLVGAPNVGKSSLLNQLAGEELAIVTPVAGTTRDRIRESITIDGVPIHITDTAGLRETQDEVEAKGIERSWDAIATSDLIIFMDALDTNNPINQANEGMLHNKVLSAMPTTCQALHVLNKVDTAGSTPIPGGVIAISAKTGDGIPELKRAILQSVGWQQGQEDVVISRRRHIDCLLKASTALEKAEGFAQDGNRSLELFAEELRLAQDHLGQITGRLLPDDLLGKIFSQFCIGK